MRYGTEFITHFRQEFPRIIQQLNEVYLQAIAFGQQRIANEEAKRFMLHGVARRLGLITRSALGIFEGYPPERVQPLPREQLENVNINLHAFILHCNVIQDNLAWCYVKEFGLVLDRREVSLFHARLQQRLPQQVQDYLNNDDLQSWRNTYSTEYRDALAHRIPAYVPPSQLNQEDALRSNALQAVFNEGMRVGDFHAVIAAQTEMNALGEASPFFMHDLGSDQHVLHPQILCDALTVIELYTVVTDNWAPPLPFPAVP